MIAFVLGRRRGWLRESALFLLIALLPTTAAALLGLRAIRNEEAAVRRELETQLAQATDQIRSDWQRGLAALETAAVAPTRLAPADEGARSARETSAVGRPPAVLPPRPAEAPFADPAVVDEHGSLVAPLGAARRTTAAEPSRACADLAARIAGATERKARDQAARRFLRECEGAQSPSGRWLWPVIALDPAHEAMVTPAQIEAWIAQHGDVLSEPERIETMAEVKRAPHLEPAARARILSALARSAEAMPALATQIAVRRGSFTGAAANGRELRWRDGQSIGTFRRLPDGGFVGFVVHAGSLARAVAAGWPSRPADVSVRLSARPPDGATSLELLESRLWLEVVAPPASRLDARTRQARLLLWGLLAAAVVLSVGLTTLLFLRMRAERRLGELRTDFVAAVSHELRTPIASLRMLSELLQQGAVEPDERGEVTDALVAEARRLGHTVDRLLTFSRMSAGRLAATHDRVSLPSVVARAVETFRARHPDHEVIVESEQDPIRVHADADQIEMAIDNLLANARKHAPDGTPYELSVERRGREVWIGLRDHGPGIDRPHQRRIFEPFERADDRLSRATEGSGIGLSLVRHVARAHGGRAWVESEAGAGATFYLSLAYDEADASDSQGESP